MLQPVASTSPLTVPDGLIFAAVMLMLSRKNPVGVQVAASACLTLLPNASTLPATLNASTIAPILDIPIPLVVCPRRHAHRRPATSHLNRRGHYRDIATNVKCRRPAR